MDIHLKTAKSLLTVLNIKKIPYSFYIQKL